MLTGDLVRVRIRKGVVHPTWVDPGDEGLAQDARWLCELVSAGLARGARRGELEAEVHEEAQVRPDHKVLRGLAKVLLDRADFATGELQGPDGPVPPAVLRDRVFKEAAASGPLGLDADALGRACATDVLTRIGAELGVGPEAVREALYADRKEEQRLVACDVPAPDALLHRYNVALVQAVLLKATRMAVTLEEPTAPRVRQLLRHAKFHQLLHRAWREGPTLHLEIDGPESVLKQSTRYGMKLASFFPAVLLQERWSLSAEIVWSRGRRSLALDQDAGLQTHLADRGGYETRTSVWFRERWAALGCDWSMEEGAEPIDLGGRAVVMPDFTFRRDGRVAHLEIVGVWRRDALDRRIDALRRDGPGNLVLAVSRKLVADGSGLEDLGLEVIPFGDVVPAKAVLEAVDRVAVPEGVSPARGARGRRKGR